MVVTPSSAVSRGGSGRRLGPVRDLVSVAAQVTFDNQNPIRACPRCEDGTPTCPSDPGVTMPATRTAPPARARKTATPKPPPPPGIERTPTNCRAREMIVRVADKWSMYVIHVLASAGPLRFNEIRRRVDGVSQRMLTVTLRGLERDGLVQRSMYPEVPPRVEYALTPLGATLRDLVRELIDWSGR